MLAVQPKWTDEAAFHQRKDTRKLFMRAKPLMASCLTMKGKFRDRVHNLSSSGVFLETHRHLSVGQEIALTIPLPNSKDAIRATGEIVRANHEGVGVEFKVIFNY